MKRMLFILAVCISMHASAQVSQGTVEYDKKQVPCYIAETQYATGVTEDAIKERFKKMGVNGTDRKGFTEYRNVIIPEISSSPVDALIKVKKKDKASSTIYMIVNPIGVNENSATGSNGMADFSAGTTTFLSSLQGNAQDLNLENEIKKQEEEVKKAEKKQKNLVEDNEDMKKKIEKLQKDIEENVKKQESQTNEVQKQRDILTQMVGRRRKG